MTRRRAALLGVAAAGAVILTRRARQRASVAPGGAFTDATVTAATPGGRWLHPVAVIVAVWLVVRMQLRQTFSDGGVINTLGAIGGFFSGLVTAVVGDIASAVAHAIDWSLGLVNSWLSTIWLHFTDLIGVLPAAFHSVVDFVDSVEQQLFDFVSARFEQFYDGLSGAVQTVLAGAGWLRDWIVDVATSLLTDALSATGSFVAWLWEHIIDPIYQAIAGVTAGLASLVAQLVNDALDVAASVGGWLYSLIVSVAQTLVNDALAVFNDLFEVVRGAWDFLVWVALHPFDWFEQLATSILNLSGETVLGALESAITSNESGVESLLDRLFG